jgi:hypothetical protein
VITHPNTLSRARSTRHPTPDLFQSASENFARRRPSPPPRTIRSPLPWPTSARHPAPGPSALTNRRGERLYTLDRLRPGVLGECRRVVAVPSRTANY